MVKVFCLWMLLTLSASAAELAAIGDGLRFDEPGLIVFPQTPEFRTENGLLIGTDCPYVGRTLTHGTEAMVVGLSGMENRNADTRVVMFTAATDKKVLKLKNGSENCIISTGSYQGVVSIREIE